jgi:hypothetical protein
VLNDFDGVLLEKLGAAGTPFIVVIDGTRATKEKPDFLVLYKNAGFEGTKKLRLLIDGIKPLPKPWGRTRHRLKAPSASSLILLAGICLIFKQPPTLCRLSPPQHQAKSPAHFWSRTSGLMASEQPLMSLWNPARRLICALS